MKSCCIESNKKAQEKDTCAKWSARTPEYGRKGFSIMGDTPNMESLTRIDILSFRFKTLYAILIKGAKMLIAEIAILFIYSDNYPPTFGQF